MPFNLPISADTVTIWGGGIASVVALVAFLHDSFRKGRFEWVTASYQIAAFVIGIAVCIAGNLSSREHDARDAAMQTQLDQNSQAIGNVSVGEPARDLSQPQITALATALRDRPVGLKIDVQRCISAESAIPLASDFARAVNLAGAPISLGNVTTACPTGVVVGVHTGDSQTMQFAERAFDSVAGLKAQGVYTKDVAATTMVIYVGTKTPQTL